MTRTMYDSVTPHTIPSSAELVAGYLTPSPFAWPDAGWALFPGARHVEIQISSQVNSGHVLDVETGDAPPEHAPGWVAMRRAAGADPTVYCNTSTWPSVRAAFVAAGVPEPHYWLAQYDGDPTIPAAWSAAGVVAKQYRTTSSYDVSSVADYWPGVDPDPAPTSAPAPLEDDMPTLATGQLVPGFACDVNGVVVDATKATMIVTPPANGGALPWGNMWLSLGCDFDPVKVRVAIHDGTGWSVKTVTVNPPDGRLVVAQLPTNVGKISLCRVPLSAQDTGGSTPVGWLLEAGGR